MATSMLAWVIPATALLNLLAIGLLPFFRALPPETRRRPGTAGAIFLGDVYTCSSAKPSANPRTTSNPAARPANR